VLCNGSWGSVLCSCELKAAKGLVLWPHPYCYGGAMLALSFLLCHSQEVSKKGGPGDKGWLCLLVLYGAWGVGLWVLSHRPSNPKGWRSG
jgi:hypothetical protein